jgi:hypothetical protein
MLLKVDPSDGSLITDFSSDGAVETPDDDTQGITFFDNSLWIISDGSFGPTLYRVSPVTGLVSSTAMLNQCPNP